MPPCLGASHPIPSRQPDRATRGLGVQRETDRGNEPVNREQSYSGRGGGEINIRQTQQQSVRVSPGGRRGAPCGAGDDV
jgi:hypothetical protein